MGAAARLATRSEPRSRESSHSRSSLRSHYHYPLPDPSPSPPHPPPPARPLAICERRNASSCHLMRFATADCAFSSLAFPPSPSPPLPRSSPAVAAGHVDASCTRNNKCSRFRLALAPPPRDVRASRSHYFAAVNVKAVRSITAVMRTLFPPNPRFIARYRYPGGNPRSRVRTIIAADNHELSTNPVVA